MRRGGPGTEEVRGGRGGGRRAPGAGRARAGSVGLREGGGRAGERDWAASARARAGGGMGVGGREYARGR